MQLYSPFVWLLLICVFVGIRARNVFSNTNEQTDEDNYNANVQQRRSWHNPELYPNRFFNWKLIQPVDQDRILVETRRAKAIIKGDPREFMG